MLNNDLEKIFAKIEPDAALENRIIERMEAKEMKKSTKRNVRHLIAVAACVAVAGISTAFAAGNVISYFQSDKAVELTSMEELSLYNEEIGKSFSKDGYTLTLDNIAADDNFIHVFYTIKSDSVPFYEGDNTRTYMLSDGSPNPQMDIQVVINGQLAGFESNHNTQEGYFADNYTYKAAEKYNIASLNIPDSFKVEIFGELVDDNFDWENSAYSRLFKMGDTTVDISDEDKASLWYVSADVDKSQVKVNSVTKDLNAKLPWVDGGTLEKVVFSPFGNQLVVSTEEGSDPEAALRIDLMALFDENGTCLDVLNTDLCGGISGSSKNAIEFMKANKDTKKLKLVPVKFEDHGDCGDIVLPVGNYPQRYEINNNGAVVVTDVRFKDGQVEIDYYKDGFVMFDPGFRLMDDNGENAEPGGKLGCVLYTDVHYNTNSYTARYVYDAREDDGKPIPMDDSVKAENLKNKITKLGIVEQKYINLDNDNALEVDLK